MQIGARGTPQEQLQYERERKAFCAPTEGGEGGAKGSVENRITTQKKDPQYFTGTENAATWIKMSEGRKN